MIGRTLGPYHVVEKLGEGGMGEVYRAIDTRLKRPVAIKVLPESLAADAERLARFQREAEVLASLNHPNIAAVYGLEDAGGSTALVMELVEGPTLADRIAQGALPVEEALPIAAQMVEALAAAHGQGIVHRDLKPANVKVRPDGTVKVLDFGLAKALGAEPARADAGHSQSPTLMSPAQTQQGVILGTAAYMAPEQAKGKAVDQRADVWAFGVVLYEMITGERLFGGDSIPDTLARVLRDAPDSSRVPLQVRPALEACLAKDPEKRLRDISDVRWLLDRAPSAPDEAVVPSRSRSVLPWAVAAMAAALAVAAWWRPQPEAAAPAPAIEFSVAPAAGATLAPQGSSLATPALSPDGRSLVFQGGGASWLRRLDSSDPVRVVRRTGRVYWSNDSAALFFGDGDTLHRIVAPDGAVETVASAIPGPVLGLSVSSRGTILFVAAGSRNALYVVRTGDGGSRPIEVEGLPEGDPLWPQFLPGSEDFLLLLETSSERTIYLATLRDGRATDASALMTNETAASYTPAGGGQILFVRDDTLYAQRLNASARRLEGEPRLIQRGVASSPGFRHANFSVSSTGTIAWRAGIAGRSIVRILDRSGAVIGTAGPPSSVQSLRLAPDETRLLVAGGLRAWLLEPNRSGSLPLEQGSQHTLWHPTDSARVLHVVRGPDGPRLVDRPVTGPGPVIDLHAPPGLVRPEDISPDGTTLLFNSGVNATDVFAARLDAPDEEPQSLVRTGETIVNTRFGPDGRWILYRASSRDAGGIYVQPFPGPGLRTQIAGAGNNALWRRDGREIVYLAGHQGATHVWSVPVTMEGATPRFGAATPLFPVRLPAAVYGDWMFWAVSRDGSRFYVAQAVDQPDDGGVIRVRTQAVP